MWKSLEVSLQLPIRLKGEGRKSSQRDGNQMNVKTTESRTDIRHEKVSLRSEVNLLRYIIRAGCPGSRKLPEDLELFKELPGSNPFIPCLILL